MDPHHDRKFATGATWGQFYKTFLSVIYGFSVLLKSGFANLINASFNAYELSICVCVSISLSKTVFMVDYFSMFLHHVAML
jgi:hypothetical protein